MGYKTVRYSMKYPKMIMFDSGQTLRYGKGFNSRKGNAAVLAHATENPNGVTPEDIKATAERLFIKPTSDVRAHNIEVCGINETRYLYEYLGLKFDVSYEKLAEIFTENASDDCITPGIEELLSYLENNGIRTAVVSNLLWPSELLKSVTDKAIPNNKFEFVITSCDYFFAKPSKQIFEIALKKAGLDGEDVWYCGDNPLADVMGSASAGIFPVWYDSREITFMYKDDSYNTIPTCEHLHIGKWQELIEEIDKLK